MSWMTVRKAPERCAWAALILCTLYQSYRYPLQMNSTGTSPTYSDTPIAFQAGKFVLALPFCALASLYVLKRLLPFRKWVLAAFIVCMSAFCVVKGIEAWPPSAVYIDVSFWPMAALVLALAVRSVSIEALNRYFAFVFFLALASDVVQVVLFLTIGRLPALAYAGTLSVRFGGFLDDPNGSPALWYMLMGWAYYRFSGWRRLLAETSLILCVLLTQSFTAMGTLGLLSLLLIGSYLLRRPNPLLIIACCVLLAIAMVALWGPVTHFYSLLIQERLGSFNQHLSQVTGTNTHIGLEWLYGVSPYVPYESWWIGSAINFGIPWYLLSLAVVGTLDITAFRAFRRARSAQQKAVFCGILMLAFYFTLGNANLPLFQIFPIDFLFFFLTSLIFFGRVGDDRSLAVKAPVRRAPSIGPLNAEA